MWECVHETLEGDCLAHPNNPLEGEGHRINRAKVTKKARVNNIWSTKSERITKQEGNDGPKTLTLAKGHNSVIKH